MKITIHLPGTLIAERRTLARAHAMSIDQGIEDAVRARNQRQRRTPEPFRFRDGSADLGESLVPNAWAHVRRPIYEARGE